MGMVSFVSRRLAAHLFGSLLAAAFFLAAPASGQAGGYWHTSGELILDANDKPVRITGINWYGFESNSGVVGGLYAQDYKIILQTLKSQGFNTIRIPLSSQTIETPGKTLNIAFSNGAGAINTDLTGLDSLQVLDRIVNQAGRIGLKIILDHHRSEAGNSAEENGLWYTASYPEASWIADWTALASRYQGNATVIGFDLHNEPHAVNGAGACWDCGGANDWHLAAERAGNAVLSVNPKLLIFVEGVDAYQGDFYWWGGNLEGVKSSPVTLNVAHQLVYSPHEYGPHEAPQRWFSGTTSYASLSDTWSKHWAYISREKIAPVWLGEFGTTNLASDMRDTTPGSQGQWFESLVTYLNANPNLSWSYWAVNGEDNYGLLATTYAANAQSTQKLQMLASTRQRGSTEMNVSASGSGTVPENSWSWALIGGSGLTFAFVFSKRLKKGEDGDNDPVPAGFPPAAAVETMTPPTLTAVVVASGHCGLTWQPSAIPGISYTLYVGSTAHQVSGVVATGLTSSNYLVTHLSPETVFFFAVKATANGYEDARSRLLKVTTPAHKTPVAAGPAKTAEEIIEGLPRAAASATAPSQTGWQARSDWAWGRLRGSVRGARARAAYLPASCESPGQPGQSAAGPA